MTVEATQVAFTLTAMSVAALDVSNWTYGTPVSLEYGQSLGFEPQHDTDQLKAYGKIVQMLSVLTHITGTLSQGLIDYPAYAVMVGQSQTSSGTPPNVHKILDAVAGGSGMPYFGLVGKLATLQNGDLHIGFPMCKLEKMPGFTVEQNKFVLPSTNIVMVTPATASKPFRMKTHETATSVYTNFNTFFTGMLP